MRAIDGQPITFAEWGYLSKGKYQRRDFRFDVLTGSSKYSEEGSLFADLGKHEIFTPRQNLPVHESARIVGFARRNNMAKMDVKGTSITSIPWAIGISSR